MCRVQQKGAHLECTYFLDRFCDNTWPQMRHFDLGLQEMFLIEMSYNNWWLEATALSFGDKPFEQGDAIAIQAAEMKATRTNEITPCGVTSMPQSAANENKTTLYDTLAVINFCSLLICLIMMTSSHGWC